MKVLTACAARKGILTVMSVQLCVAPFLQMQLKQLKQFCSVLIKNKQKTITTSMFKMLFPELTTIKHSFTLTGQLLTETLTAPGAVCSFGPSTHIGLLSEKLLLK